MRMQIFVMRDTCRCGSGLLRRPLYDARGIYVQHVCDKCEANVKQGYRAEVFTNPNYTADEPIEGDP